MQSSILIELFCSLKVLDDFFHSFAVFNRPQWLHPNIDPNPPSKYRPQCPPPNIDPNPPSLYKPASSLFCFLYVAHGTYRENLLNNQEILDLAIFSFILMTVMFDLRGDTVGTWVDVRRTF